MLFALDARQFFSPCVYLDDGNENAFGGCFPARRVFSALVQKATASLSELIVSLGWAASTVGPRSTLPRRQNGDGNARESVSQAAYGISDHGQALASEVDYAEGVYTVRIEARPPTD